MKANELRQKSTDELKALLVELLREGFNLKMQKATKQLTKNHQIKNVRRDVARIHTVLTEMAGS